MRGGNSNDRIAGVGGRCRNPKCALSPAIYPSSSSTLGTVQRHHRINKERLP
jgi:hypothetical protein